jgi:hypothetical protein
MLPFPPLVAVVSLTVLAQPAGDIAPTPDHVRQAITRSLPFVETEGVAWMKKRGCLSCHQVPLMMWSLNEASRRGFAVDTQKLKQWNEWSLTSAFGGNMHYQLSEQSIKKLRQAKLPEQEMARLQPLANQAFLTEAEFEGEIGKLLSPASAAQHKNLILQHAQPGVGGGGGDGPSAVYTVMLHTGTAAATRQPDKARQALLEGLRRTQQKDGIWTTSSQFHGIKRPKPESNEINTRWALLALSAIDALPEPLVQAQARAQQAIKGSAPGASTESLMLHLLLAHKANREERSRELLAQLLQSQRADGGWAAFKDNPDSDALTTGQVLYALGTIGRGSADPGVANAWQYLLRTQQPDGSWLVPWLAFNVENKKDHREGDRVFSYWGTTWAVLGLLYTLPK